MRKNTTYIYEMHYETFEKMNSHRPAALYINKSFVEVNSPVHVFTYLGMKIDSGDTEIRCLI